MAQSSYPILFTCLLAFSICFWTRPYPSAQSRPWLRAPASALREHPGHSHNDYLQQHPLDDALANRFPSVEADIWLRGNTLEVSHFGWFSAGTLQQLYLEPLQKRVDALGSVYGDRRTFILWLDIKSDGSAMAGAIQSALSHYPMLTRFAGNTAIPAPVEVILTGNDDVKRAYIHDFPLRYAVRDSNDFDEKDPPAAQGWLWYSLYWPSRYEWDGYGPMPENERQDLAELVARIHSKGRKLRFWGGPDNPQVWEVSYQAGVDLINTDSLPELSGYFSTRNPATTVQPQSLSMRLPQ